MAHRRLRWSRRACLGPLQRRQDNGYTRASRLIGAMDRHSLVSPLQESGSREVLVSIEEWQESRG